MESRRCSRHARTFQRKARRCDRPGCAAILDDPAQVLGAGRTRGRSHPGPLGITITYCHRCEHLLLKLTPEAESENVHELFRQLIPAPEGSGWLWTGEKNTSGYGLMVPAGGTHRHKWLVHRVMVGLLFGGHRVTEQLDHRDRDRLNVAPWNLEPVSRAENRRRRDRAPLGPLPRLWSYRAAVLARDYGLPVPTGFPTWIDYLAADAASQAA